MLKARTFWLFGIALALAGLVPVVSFVVHSLLRGEIFAPMLEAVPRFSAPWLVAFEAALPLHKLKAVPGGLLPGLVFAALGVGVMALGDLIVKRQATAMEEENRLREDRLRRARLYRDARVEPYLGAEAIDPDAEGDAPERRVA